MAEQDFQSAAVQVTRVGKRLADARQVAGLSLADLAERTRIAGRYLAAIEEGRFSDLASRAYAVGFARTYARAVGLDENVIVKAVREEMTASEDAERAQKPAAFEPGDPARVPGVSLAVLSMLGVVLVLVSIFVFWRSYFFPSASLPDLIQEDADPPRPAASSAPAPAVADAPAADASVVFTAMAPDIWVKFYDGAGKQLMQKQMALGESYTVPADTQAPRIWTGHPEALRITIGGKPVPPLSDKQITMKDVPVSAAALLVRKPQVPVAAAAPAPSPTPSASTAPAVTAARPARVIPPSPASSEPADASTVSD